MSEYVTTDFHFTAFLFLGIAFYNGVFLKTKTGLYFNYDWFVCFI